MKRVPRARVLPTLAAALLASGVSLFAACGGGDPGPAAPGPDASEASVFIPFDASEAAASSADADAGTASDARQNWDAPGDEVDATAREDAAKIEAGAPCPNPDPCDCDNDGYRSTEGACGGNDCDDRDALRHPNQGYVSEPPEPPADGNWNCVGPIEEQYTTNLNCSSLLGGCNGQGFAGDPACGAVAPYIGCEPVVAPLVGCRAVDAGTRRQGCK